MISNQLHEELDSLSGFLSNWGMEDNHRLLLISPCGEWWSMIVFYKMDSDGWWVRGGIGGKFAASSLLKVQPTSHFHFVAYPCADLISLAGMEYDGLRDFLLSWHLKSQDPEVWPVGC